MKAADETPPHSIPQDDVPTNSSTSPSDEASTPVSPQPTKKACKWHSWLTGLGGFEVSYRSCVAIFVAVATCIAILPFKEYYLGSYVTKPFDEVRYDIVARQLNQLGVVMNAVHYFDSFDRANLRLVDGETQADFNRDDALTLSFSTFLVRANIRRAELLSRLPQDILALRVNTMTDMHAPLCGQSLSTWETPPQVLFGNWFPAINHEFCRDFHSKFPLNRFFDQSKAPTDANLSDIGSVTLGLISVVNMSEVYLRQFTDSLVIRKIMKNVQEGFLGMELPDYTDAVADAVVSRYKKGIAVADLVALLPGSIDNDHVALVDVLGVSVLLTHYLTPQQLTMGINVNSEAAILAEVTHATASFVTADYLSDNVGMHYVSTVHAAPYWACSIKYTSMDKGIKVSDVDIAAIKQCGSDQTATLPVFIVNLMYLYQAKRDYTKMDNTTTFALGRRRESDIDYIPLSVPETFADSTLLSMDGSAWSKAHKETPQTLAETPYGYALTPDCGGLVNKALQQTGRNVQKYQAYLGDGLGNCVYHDSQEIAPQTLCRLFMTADELLYRSLDGSLLTLPTCSSLLTVDASDAMVALELENLREVEWFMIDTTFVSRTVRIQDNTSRQIRTFLLMLNLLGAVSYSFHYIFILWSVWTFIRNSIYRPVAVLSRHGSNNAKKYSTDPPARLTILELLQCDPADGALLHPGTMALLYLGAIGSLSNIFSLGCSAFLSDTDGNVAISCAPSIPISSLTLAFTSLSSSYWIIRITLQTRSLAVRLAHASRNDLPRFWLLNFTTVLAIHFTTKSIADVIFQKMHLRSDPHLNAIIGSFIVTLCISAGYLLVQALTVVAGRGSRQDLHKRRSGSVVWRQSSAQAELERRFTGKWSSNELNSVLNHCATPQIAWQLELTGRRRVLGHTDAPLVSDATAASRNVSIRIQEFVSLHCAAGAHANLQRIKWGADGGITAIEGPLGTPRVHAMQALSKNFSFKRDTK
ncbi:hypothetical protein PHYBOEH_008850 [Phytophthora boehmeriae]|uniref:Transmembrane protein n=1 Tax=Phytophthora boehmeriae TaxID=109152 RepID=A0A8T1X518_9STRA|nr:hypothetical protein PHYBOEH_008850 [Phytophthora boehmeriae]